MWGGSKRFFLSPAGTPPTLCRARVRVFTPLSETQDCRFFVFVQFRPADTLLSPEPGGDQGTLFAHDVVQGYIYILYICDCVLSFFVCVVLALLVSAKRSSPSRGVGGVTFHSGYVCVVSLSNPRHANGLREVFGVTSPLYFIAFVPLPFDKGLPCHSAFSVVCWP